MADVFKYGEEFLEGGHCYTTRVDCLNCGHSDDITIRKGVLVAAVACPNCRCTKLIPLMVKE